MLNTRWILLFLLCFCRSNSQAQYSSLNFHKISLQDGLNDGTIRCIGQDKFGYIWIGSVGALNRFDGKTVRNFANIPGDTTSAYASQPRTIHSDSKGRLWIGFETGFAEFNFQNSTFRRITSFKDVFISKVISFSDSLLFLVTNSGFIRYNINTGFIFNYSHSHQPEFEAFQGNTINDIVIKNDSLYLASHNGVVIMNLYNAKTLLVPVPVLKNMPIRRIAVDKYGNMWLGTFSGIKLVRLYSDHVKSEIFDRFLTSAINTQPLNVMGIMSDSKQRIWVITALDGLLEYVDSSNSFKKHLHDGNITSSPSGNNYRCIFQDKNNTIWLGCDALGVNYFEPDKNYFKVIMPFPDVVNDRGRAVGRAITEDSDGYLWMGNHDGVTKYDMVSGKYSIWRNEEGKSAVLYSNLIRAIVCDDENNIWIGTGSGVNRYNNVTQKMEFIDSKYLPLSFYNSITMDRSRNVWFCTNDTASLYWYSLDKKKFYNISQHTQLRKYSGYAPTSYVMEDSKNRLWISFSRKGILMFDKKTLETKHYMASDTAPKGIIGNQVVDIKEDKDGFIWVTSFNGFNGIDVERNEFISFNNRNGLPGNMTGPLVVDKQNRVWVGVNGGLVMVNQDRKQLTTFTLNDGLSSDGFPEHAGIMAGNGDIILPSYNGFIRFNPEDYKEEKTDLNFYIKGYLVFNKEYPVINEEDNSPVLNLKANENSFTFNLVALNYISPAQTWYAYKLEGFEREWHYTRDPKAVYTNIPGGTYTFLYKASTNNNSWEAIEAKHVSVKIKTIFYRSIWFWTAIILILMGILYGIYTFRIRKQRELFQLKSKAQLLEKEKAMVMYEGLKQHLNPHFLFNSLTSLSGLIETDQQMAGNFLDQMSKIYRYILKNRDAEVVSLREEIEFVQIYIQLQKTRFKNGLRVNFNIDDDKMQNKIAPVTLQNMLENAIKHNIIDKDSPLVVDIYNENGYLIIKNNLQKKHVVESSNKQGLASLQSLYKYLSKDPVVFGETNNHFYIKIPLI